MTAPPTSPRPRVAGLTQEESEAVHDFVDFLREAVDAYDAIMAWRRGTEAAPVPWPALVKAVPPDGPDICRWEWEDISERGRELVNRIVPAMWRLGETSDPAHARTAGWLKGCFHNHKAYRLVRYAWYDHYRRDFRGRMDTWAVEVRALLDAMPLELGGAGEA